MALDRLWNAISEALFGDTANSRTQFENVRTWAQIAAPVVWHDVERGIRSDAFSVENPPGTRANRARKVRT